MAELDPWEAGVAIGWQSLNKLLGINPDSYKSAKGQSSTDWSKRWTSDLGSLTGFYDQKKVSTLLGGLGAQSSSTYLNQLSTLASESNKLYTFTQNPNQVKSMLSAAAKANGGNYQLGYSGYQIANKTNHSTNDYVYDAMGNRYSDITMSPVFSMLYDQIDRFSNVQGNIVNELTAQQGREQNFISQINQLTQTATLAKSKAEQQAAAKALADQQAKDQAALNASAAANTAKLEQQKKQQEAQFASAQKEAAANAAKQQLLLNQTALTNASSSATTSQLEQVKLTAQQAENRANTVSGGEATVTTNAAPVSKTRQTTRTERWQSTRSPATGGGGLNV